MTLLCLLSALCSSMSPRQAQSTAWYNCSGSVYPSNCTGSGVAVYVSFGTAEPPEPTYFWLKSVAIAGFSRDILDSAGISSSEQKRVSPKFTGVFVAEEDGNHTFQLNMTHDDINGLHLPSDYQAGIIDLDISDSDTKYAQTCRIYTNSTCTSYGVYGNCQTCHRTFTLTKGTKYRFVAGFVSSIGATWDSDPVIQLLFNTSANPEMRYVDSTNSLVNADEATTLSSGSSANGLVSGSSGSVSSGNGSGSSSVIVAIKNKPLIVGLASGCAVLAAIVVAAAISFFFIFRKNKKGEAQEQTQRSSRSSKSSRRSDRHHKDSGRTRKH